MLAEHDEAHGQRRRHQQAERPPQPRPERHGRQQRHLRDPGRPGIQHRLEHEIREELEHDKQADDPERSGPTIGGRQADQDRRACAEHGPDVRDESENRAERRPDQWVRHAEEVEPGAGGDAVDAD